MSDGRLWLHVLYAGLFCSVALTSVVIALAKLLALRYDRSRSLLVITSGSVLATCAFVVMLPPVYRWIGSLSGMAGLGTLVIHLCVYGFATHSHLLVAMWARESLPDLRTCTNPRTLAALYAFLAAVMTALYLSAGLTASGPVVLSAGHAGDPRVFAFLTLAWGTGAGALFATARGCRRINAAVGSGDPRMRRALRAIGCGSLLIAGSYLLRELPLLADAVAPGDGRGPRLAAPLLASVGSHLVQYGYIGPAWSAWLRERRDFRALRPLWDLTVRDCDTHLMLHPPGRLTESFALNVGSWYLPRRVMEISDALRSLQPWMSPEPVRRLAAGGLVAPERITTFGLAATLLDATSRKLQGLAPLDADVAYLLPDLPPGDGRARLVEVAAALGHPLVAAAAAVDGAGSDRVTAGPQAP